MADREINLAAVEIFMTADFVSKAYEDIVCLQYVCRDVTVLESWRPGACLRQSGDTCRFGIKLQANNRVMCPACLNYILGQPRLLPHHRKSRR